MLYLKCRVQFRIQPKAMHYLTWVTVAFLPSTPSWAWINQPYTIDTILWTTQKKHTQGNKRQNGSLYIPVLNWVKFMYNGKYYKLHKRFSNEPILRMWVSFIPITGNYQNTIDGNYILQIYIVLSALVPYNQYRDYNFCMICSYREYELLQYYNKTLCQEIFFIHWKKPLQVMLNNQRYLWALNMWLSYIRLTNWM